MSLIIAMPFSSFLVWFFFFFSSRRRHTRCSRDWSSDVCSSDLHVERTRDADAGHEEGRVGPPRHQEHRLVGGRQQRRQRPVQKHGDAQEADEPRSEERRVGKEGRSRWAPHHLKKKKTER